jgi:hypothetical protein
MKNSKCTLNDDEDESSLTEDECSLNETSGGVANDTAGMTQVGEDITDLLDELACDEEAEDEDQQNVPC